MAEVVENTNVDDKKDTSTTNVDTSNKDESTKEEVKKEDTVVVEETKQEDDTSEKEEEVKEETIKKEVDSNKVFEAGWYNNETGSIDFSKIKNEEVLNAIQLLNDKYVKEKETRLINDSLNDELKNYSITVSKDTFRKVLDMKDVKVDKDGKVVGIKDAIEALKAIEPGFFLDKEKQSNTINEGFNPVDKRDTALSEDALINMAYGAD